MNDKLDVIASELLAPETEDGESSLLVVLGRKPSEVFVAYIASSRLQLAALLQSLHPHVNEGQVRNILTAAEHIDSFPDESDDPVEVLEEEAAQIAYDQFHCDDEADTETEAEVKCFN